MDKLLVLCFFGAVFGMLSLLAIARSIKPVEKSINEITDSDVGKQLIVRGMVTSITRTNGNYFFSICDKKCIRIAIFRKMAESISKSSTDLSKLKNGDRVSIEAIVKIYKDSLSLEPIDQTALQVEGKK